MADIFAYDPIDRRTDGRTDRHGEHTDHRNAVNYAGLKYADFCLFNEPCHRGNEEFEKF